MTSIKNARYINILISESKIGIHSESNTDYFKIFDLTFLIETERCPITGNIKLKNVLKENKVLLNSVELYKKYHKKDDKVVNILLGFDLDIQGELMAQTFRLALIEAGVDEEYIIRTPLTEDGYIMFTTFKDIEHSIMYYHYQKEYMEYAKKNNIKPFGFRTILAIKYLAKYANTYFFIKNNYGTSTITTITKSINPPAIRDKI